MHLTHKLYAVFPSEKQKNRKESKNFCEIRRISN